MSKTSGQEDTIDYNWENEDSGVTNFMMLDWEACSRARLSRDARFDGKFFIAVRSTKIYCRPICPVPTVKEKMSATIQQPPLLPKMDSAPAFVVARNARRNSWLVRQFNHRFESFAADRRERPGRRWDGRPRRTPGCKLSASQAVVYSTLRCAAKCYRKYSPPALWPRG